MNSLVTLRDGIPAFARRITSGEPVTIVAFGTSMTYGGQYLARVVPVLEAATGNAKVTLINSGQRGFISFWAAFRVPGDVLPHAPDLVLIEFAHNDVTDDALADSRAGLDGIIAQIRDTYPACEFIFVYLAMRGAAATGPTRAMLAHEETAAHYGFPSIDLATLSERLVASGAASWTGDGAPALTHDGVHHAEGAIELLGEPFAAALLELVHASGASMARRADVRDRTYSRTWREPASTYIAEGAWGRGLPRGHEDRIVEAYTENVAVPTSPGGLLRIPFTGRQVYVWALGAGALTVSFAGRPERFHVPVESGDQWRIRALMPMWESGTYTLEVSIPQPTVMLGDVFFVGPPSEPPAGV